MSAPKTLQIRSFPKGTWRVTWLGDAGTHLAGRNFSQLSYALSMESLSSERKHRQEVHLPVGFLGMTPIGSLWVDGIRDPNVATGEELRAFKIHTARTTLIPAGASAQHGSENVHLLPFEHYRGHGDHTSSWLLRCETDDNVTVLIPALEIVRFYFGSSSSLLRRVFSYALDRKALWQELSYDERTGHAHIVLDDGISGASAADIARLALDANAYNTAASVWHSLFTNHVTGQPTYPKVRLPLHGYTTLHVGGIALARTTRQPVFVVHEIRSCSAPFPFQSVTYTSVSANQRGSRRPSTDEQSKTRESKKLAGATRVLNGHPLSDQEPKKSNGVTLMSFLSPSKFVDLDRKEIRRVTPESGAIVLIGGGNVSAELASGNGSGSGSGRRVDLSPSEKLKPVAAKLPLYCPNPAWKPFFEFIEELARRNKDITIEFIPLSDRQVHAHLSNMPVLVDEDGVIPPTAFAAQMDVGGGLSTRRLRLVSVASVRLRGKSLTLISPEPPDRSVTDSPPCPFHLFQGVAIGNRDSLTKIVAAIAARTSSWPSDERYLACLQPSAKAVTEVAAALVSQYASSVLRNPC